MYALMCRTSRHILQLLLSVQPQVPAQSWFTWNPAVPVVFLTHGSKAETSSPRNILFQLSKTGSTATNVVISCHTDNFLYQWFWLKVSTSLRL